MFMCTQFIRIYMYIYVVIPSDVVRIMGISLDFRLTVAVIFVENCQVFKIHCFANSKMAFFHTHTHARARYLSLNLHFTKILAVSLVLMNASTFWVCLRVRVYVLCVYIFTKSQIHLLDGDSNKMSSCFCGKCCGYSDKQQWT